MFNKSILLGLMKIANNLDKKGFYKEADSIDNIIKESGFQGNRMGLLEWMRDTDGVK